MFCVQRFAKQLALRHQWNSLLAPSSRALGTTFTLQGGEGASDSAEQNIYELRIYTIKVERIREFLTLTSEEFHLRTAHSKLLGYWTSEIGGLNQVVHIWEYDNLTHRAQVRANLANDPNWNSRYLGRVVPMFQEMTNSAMTLLPGVGIHSPSGKGVYELQTLTLNGSPKTWSQALVGYVKACKGIGSSGASSSHLVGAWKSVIGPRQMAALLWQHPGPDSCVSLHQATEELDESTALSPFIAQGHNRLLLPHPVSPLQ